MFTWINSLLDPLKALCQSILNVFVDLFPTGALWSILGGALFVVAMAAALYGLVKLLRRLHSGEYVREVTCAFTTSHILLGAALGIAGVINPSDGKWQAILLSIFVCWAAGVLLLAVKRIFEFENPPHGRLFYLAIGAAYCVELMLVGLLALLVAYAAIAIIIAVTVGIGVVAGGAKSMMSGSSGGGAVLRHEATLDDGTRLIEEGISWREVGGYKTYHENMDGSFSPNA